MALYRLTTDQLIDSIKRRSMVPDSDKTYSEADIIEMINEEIFTSYLPYIMKTHEEYLVEYEDTPLSDSQSAYDIPDRAVGNKLRDVAFVDSSGNVYELSRVDIEDISEFQGNYAVSRRNVFYLQNNQVVLPTNLISQSGSIRMYYYLRPNSLVEESRAGTIIAIDTNTGEITLNSTPTHFTDGAKYDFVSSKNPNKILAFGKTNTAVNSATNTITFSADDIPSGLEVGDYVLSEHETIIPQIPVELHTLLAQKVAVTMLESLGDTEGATNLMRKLQKMETNTLAMIENRVEGAPQKIGSRKGPVRSAVSKGYGRRF